MKKEEREGRTKRKIERKQQRIKNTRDKKQRGKRWASGGWQYGGGKTEPSGGRNGNEDRNRDSPVSKRGMASFFMQGVIEVSAMTNNAQRANQPSEKERATERQEVAPVTAAAYEHWITPCQNEEDRFCGVIDIFIKSLPFTEAHDYL